MNLGLKLNWLRVSEQHDTGVGGGPVWVPANTAEVKTLCPMPQNLQISNTSLWQVKKLINKELNDAKSTHTKLGA